MQSKIGVYNEPAKSARRAFKAVMLTYHGINLSMGSIGATNYEQVLGSKAKPPMKKLGNEVDTKLEREAFAAGSRSYGHDGIHYVADVELAAKRTLPPHLLATFKNEYLKKIDEPTLHSVHMREVEDLLGAAFMARGLHPVGKYFSKVAA